MMSIARMPSESIRDLTYVLTENGVFLAFAGFVFFKVNKWMGLWVLLCLISAQIPLYGINYDGSINMRATGVFKQSAIFARNAILIGVIWYSLIACLTNRLNVHIMLDIVCVIVFINAVMVILQNYGVDLINIVSMDYWKTSILLSGVLGAPGLVGNPNTTSGMFGFTLFLFMRRRWGVTLPRLNIRVWVLPILSIVVLVGLILTKSSNGILAFGAGLYFLWAVYAIHNANEQWRVIIPICACIIAAVLLFRGYLTGLEAAGIDNRIGIWLRGWDLFKYKPIIGYGVGHWKHLTAILHAHNDIWQAVFGTGITGGIVIAGFIAGMFSRITRETVILQASVVAIIVAASVGFIMHVPTTAIIAATLMACLCVVRKG